VDTNTLNGATMSNGVRLEIRKVELHLRRKDFRLEWYSGEGGGGQHRNKHDNCCRITHIETGIRAQATASKSRVTNQKQAFTHLVARLMDHYKVPNIEVRRTDGEVIRNYHAVRNEVHDKASGLKRLYTDVVINGDLHDMIEARSKATLGNF